MKKYGTEWIVNITDVTDFCKRQHAILMKEGEDSDNFYTASERPYAVKDFDTASRIGLDSGEGQTTVVTPEYPQ